MNPLNQGDQARIKATVQQLQANPEFNYAILSHSYEKDQEIYSKDGIEIVKTPWSCREIKLAGMAFHAALTLFKYSFLTLVQRLGIKKKGKLMEYDALVIASGIDFSDYAGRWPAYYCFFLITLFGIIMRKPVMCYSQSMGPITCIIVRSLSRFFLNRTKIISVRDESSLAFLQKLKVRKPEVHFMPDPAFFLQKPDMLHDSFSKPGSRAKNHTLIGVSLNPCPFAGPGTGYCTIGIWFKLNKENAGKMAAFYTQRMANICNILIDKYNAKLIFVPTCTAQGDNDSLIIKSVCEKIPSYGQITFMDDDISLKKSMCVIGSCDLFVGLRLHACIFAAVMGTPFVPLVGTDGPRIPGIMNTIGLDKYVCNIMTADENQVLKTIDEVWESRQLIKQTLQSRVAEVKDKAISKLELFEKMCR
jgi:polysaccharide pyruvyl transferase WcaK-like protein